MSITTSCPGCKSLFRLPEELAGQQVRCQKCAQLFVVPLVVTANLGIEPPAPPPEPTSPLPPPISVPSQPPTPELSLPEPALEPLAPPAVKDVVIEATLAEPEAPPVSQPPPLPPPPAPPPSARAALLGLLLVCFAMIGAGGGAALWVGTHLSPPRISNPGAVQRDGLAFNDRRFDKKDGPIVIDAWRDLNIDKKNAQPVFAEEIFPDLDSLLRNDRIDHPAPGLDHGRWGNDGPYRVLRIFLLQGKTYNFHVSSLDFKPRLRIFDGNVLLEDRPGRNDDRRLILPFRPNRTAEYFLFITAEDRMAGAFVMKMVAEQRVVPTIVNLNAQATFTDKSTLRLEDPLDSNVLGDGPYHEYEVDLEAKQHYTFAVTATDAKFKPVLQIFDQNPPTRVPHNEFAKRLDFSYRATFTGNVRVRVTSKNYGLGEYTLTVSRVAKTGQQIIAAFDGDGRYDDQRALVDADAKMIGRGPFKSYVVQLKKGKIYTMEMTAETFDCFLALYDANENQIKSQLGPIGKMNAVVTFQAPADGQYRIQAAAAKIIGRGPYTLRITTAP